MIAGKPRIGATRLERLHNSLVDRAVGEVLAARTIHVERDRHPPGALARDHPIGPPLDHRTDAVLRPRGHPLRPLDRIECCFAEGRAIARPLTPRPPSEGWDLKRPLTRAIAQDPSLRWGDSGRALDVHSNEPLDRASPRLKSSDQCEHRMPASA